MNFGTTSIANNGNTIVGIGAIKSIKSALTELDIKKPLICTDPGIIKINLIEKLLEEIPVEIKSVLFSNTPANPTEVAVKEATNIFKKYECDGIICFGGGSSIDLGKATALSCTHSEPLENYITQNNGATKIGPVVPIIAIPTTAGTGSEVARASVLILENGEKRIIASPHLVPKAAILDPNLTLTLPPMLTAATGMDAVSHCIEAILSPNFNPSADAIGLKGIEQALRQKALIDAYENGCNLSARMMMLVVSTQGAMAFSKGLGAVHAMSHACGKNQQLCLHHGTLNAVLLPTVLEFNKAAVESKFSIITRAIGLNETRSLPQYFRDLNQSLGLPPNLKSLGLTEDMIDDLATHAAQDMTSITNPVKMNKEKYCELFYKALSE